MLGQDPESGEQKLVYKRKLGQQRGSKKVMGVIGFKRVVTAGGLAGGLEDDIRAGLWPDVISLVDPCTIVLGLGLVPPLRPELRRRV